MGGQEDVAWDWKNLGELWRTIATLRVARCWGCRGHVIRGPNLAIFCRGADL